MFKKTSILSSSLALLLIITFSTNVFSQSETQLPSFNIKDFHLSFSGFLGSIKHFCILYDNHFAYGGGMLFKFSKAAGVQLEMNYSEDDDSFQESNEGSNNTIVNHDYIDNFKCHSYIVTVSFFPFENLNNIKVKPYFKIGLSKNDHSSYREYTREVKNNVTGEIVEYYNDIIIPKSMDKRRYRNGFVMAPGIHFSPISHFDLFIEMQYNSIAADNYEGGVFLHGGLRVKVF